MTLYEHDCWLDVIRRLRQTALSRQGHNNNTTLMTRDNEALNFLNAVRAGDAGYCDSPLSIVTSNSKHSSITGKRYRLFAKVKVSH